jgi:predicted nuclease of predicted toxin-antitoxin system
MLIRYHLDESVDPAVAAGLRQRGVDATTAREQGLLGTSDQAQLEFAVESGRLLVTHDRDFLRMAAAGTAHRGIAYSPPQALSIGEIVRRLMQLWRDNPAEFVVNRVEYL